MRDTGKPFAFGELRHHLRGNGMLHSASDIIDLHLVGEAHVFTEVEMGDLKIEFRRRILDECGRQTTIGIRVNNTPAMNKDKKHGEPILWFDISRVLYGAAISSSIAISILLRPVEN